MQIFLDGESAHQTVLSLEEKQKIHFIHFNHTNPLYHPGSNASKALINAGLQVAKQGQIFNL